MGKKEIHIALYLHIALFFFGSSAPCSSLAAAWTQSKGRGQAILALGSYNSSQFFDHNSHTKYSGNNFTKYEFNPFFEYGLTDDITIGINPLMQYWQAEEPLSATHNSKPRNCTSANDTNGEVIEAELLLRKNLFEYKNAVFSVQPLLKTPCLYFSNPGINTVWNSYELELRILAGYGFKWDEHFLGGYIRPFSGQYHFINFEAAYRKRNGELSDQVKLDGTIGLRLNKDFLLLGQVFSVISVGEEYVGSIETAKNVFEPNIDSFYNTKLQLSGVTQLTKTSSIQVGIYSDVYGKNYGGGVGVIAALWKGF